jgi:hypothetical protein
MYMTTEEPNSLFNLYVSPKTMSRKLDVLICDKEGWKFFFERTLISLYDVNEMREMGSIIMGIHTGWHPKEDFFQYSKSISLLLFHLTSLY